MKLLVKLGGTLLDAPESRDALAAQIAGARIGGVEIAVVHGGGKQMTRYLAERGIESRFVERPARHHAGDDRRGAEGVRRQRQSRTGGEPESRRRARCRADGHRRAAGRGRADGSGAGRGGPGGAVECRRCSTCWSANGYLPVVACVAGDRQGNIYNVNADQMAVACAAAFGAEQLIFLTDVEGVLDGGEDGPPAAHGAREPAADRGRRRDRRHAGEAECGGGGAGGRGRVGADRARGVGGRPGAAAGGRGDRHRNRAGGRERRHDQRCACGCVRGTGGVRRAARRCARR